MSGLLNEKVSSFLPLTDPSSLVLRFYCLVLRFSCVPNSGVSGHISRIRCLEAIGFVGMCITIL